MKGTSVWLGPVIDSMEFEGAGFGSFFFSLSTGGLQACLVLGGFHDGSLGPRFCPIRTGMTARSLSCMSLER
jgi:hypothetical protein